MIDNITKQLPGVMINPLSPWSRRSMVLWNINEGSGSLINDISGNKNHGSLIGVSPNSQSSGWGASDFGRVLNFDGVDDYVNAPLNGFPVVMKDITIDFWTKPSGDLVESCILLSVPDDDANRINIHFPYSDGNIYWDFGDWRTGGRLSLSWNSDWNDVWAHWVFISKDGVGQKIFRNGILLANNGTTSEFTPGEMTIDVGRREDVGFVYWAGSIARINIINFGMSTAEVKLLYKQMCCNILR